MEGAYSILRQLEPAQLMVEADDSSPSPKIGERWIDEGRTQTVHGNERPAGGAATCQRLAHYGSGQPRRCHRRLGVERGQQDRPTQPLIERPVAVDDLADAAITAGDQA